MNNILYQFEQLTFSDWFGNKAVAAGLFGFFFVAY
jgi:hypothetical protein